MADAIALAQFYLSEAARLADGAAVSAETRAEALRVGLWKVAQPEVIARDVVHFGPNALRETKGEGRRWSILQSHGWLVPLDPGTEVRGAARKDAWRIVKGAGNVV